MSRISSHALSHDLSNTPRTGRAARLLIVEDDAVTRKVLATRCERAGYRVDEAEDGESALEYLAEHTVDMVLLDVKMSGIDGLEVLRSIRAQQTPERLPVIMVSALDQSVDVVAALELGANDYITKPVDLSVALARIRTHLELKRAHRDLRNIKERYRLAVRGANDGLWDWDVRRRRVYFSPRWHGMLGLGPVDTDQTIETWLGRVHPQDAEMVRQQLNDHLQGKTPTLESEHRIQHKDGTYRWMLVRGLAVRKNGKATRVAGSLSDITDRRVYDPLTGLPNRILLMESLEGAIGRSLRRGLKFALLFVNVDRFSLLNSNLGHQVGDRLLVALAQRLQKCVRSGDTVACLGGDEFAVLLDDIENANDAAEFAKKLHAQLSCPYFLGGREVFCTLSVGVVISSPSYRQAEDVLRDGQTAMQRAKALGRARYEIFDTAMHENMVARFELENDLRKALENDEFRVHFQPIIEVDEGRIAGFEALVRWQHPERGLLGPGEFIPLAEETSLIQPIGIWVLREACRQIRKWQRNFPSRPPLQVSVNLSGRQFSQNDLVKRIERILREEDLEAASLKLEITESSLMDNVDRATEVMKKLRKMGVRLAIDDFGTGYSSLSYLHKFPVDTLKIDKSFVQKLGTSEGSNEDDIVGTIAALGRKLGMDVVAEGVETPQQLELLKKLDCRYTQGFLCSKPVAAEDAEKLLAQGAAWKHCMFGLGT
jgi:diguanylate cyclase (GGDEF)-like protein/PAS domain S-box-containing protein